MTLPLPSGRPVRRSPATTPELWLWASLLQVLAALLVLAILYLPRT